MTFDLRMGIRIKAPRDRLFEHILLAHHLARWWCSFAQVQPKPGGAFNFGGDYCVVPPEGHAHKCVFTGGEVRKSVTFSWPLCGAETAAKWAVEEDGEASRFRVEHAGLPRDEGPCGKIRDAYRVCLGNLKAVCEGRSDSLRPDYAPVTAPEIRHVILIDVPPRAVADALLAADRLGVWDLPPGTARPHEIERDRRLAAEWTWMGRSTSVAFDLEPKSSGTGLYLRHAGFAAADQDLVNLRGWWASLLVDLKNHLEAGDVGFLEPYLEQQTGP